VAVGVFHALGQLGDERGRQAEWHRPVALFEPPGKRGTGTIGRGDIADGANLARFVYRHQVGVLESRGGPRLPLESCAQPAVGEGVTLRDFQCHATTQSRVVREVDDPEPTPAEFAENLETAKILPR